MPIQTWCPICAGDNESIVHSLVSCPFAKQCWQALNINVVGDHTKDFNSWMDEILSSVSVKQRSEVVTLYWSIWRARNDLVWNQKISTVNKVVAAAKQYLTQWTLAQSRSYHTLLQPHTDGDGVVSWVKPQPNTIKVSVDAVIFEDRGEIGFGIIEKDSEGELILVQHELVAPVLAEAMAIKEALI